jgi:chromosome segregation ATPase
MAPKTIAIHNHSIDPVSPIRDDQVVRAEPTSNNERNSSRRSRSNGRSLNTRGTGQYAALSTSDQGMMMDPAEHEVQRRLGVEHNPEPTVAISFPATNVVNNAINSAATMATAEETITTLSTSPSSASSGTRKLRQSVKQHERELVALKNKYEEAKAKMSKMKQEKSSNKKMLLEMSGLIKALQDISVDYEQSRGDSNDSNDGSMSSSSSKTLHKAHLQNIQRKIQAIDTHMRAAKTQCGLLEEEKSLHTSTIKAQESQISALQDQINLLCQRLEHSTHSNSQDQAELQKIIQLQETQIMSLEGQISILKRNAEDRRITSMDQQNAARYQEISSLEEKLVALREAQSAHKIQASAMRSLSRSQDSQDAPIEGIHNIDEEETLAEVKEVITPPQASSKKASFGKSVRKKNKNLSLTNRSVASSSLAAISEECEGSECSTGWPEASATSASETTGNTTTTTSDDSSSTDSSCEPSSTEDGAESSSFESSTVNTRNVTVEPSEDGSSVEILDPSVTGEVFFDEKEIKPVNTTKFPISSRVDIMDDIEEEESEHMDEISSAAPEMTEENEESNLTKQLEEAKEKYDALKRDYDRVLSTSNSKSEILEQQNQQLIDLRQDLVLRTVKAMDQTSSVNELAELKEENELLRKSIAKQEAMLSFSNTKYENLRLEHTQTILELKGKAAQQEDLFSSGSLVSEEGVVDIETYTRLEKVHEAVVMKLADLGEDNDRLERERDVAKEQLRDLYSKLQTQDDSVVELQKLKEAYRLLEEERDAMQSKLEQMNDRHSVLHGSADDTICLRRDLADALARVEVLEKKNEEFGDVEAKYTASEVRVSLLEGELEKANKKLNAAKKKQAERESQIRDVIGQYKTLKGNYTQSQARVKRLESIVESDRQIAAKTTKKSWASESIPHEKTSSSAAFSATRIAAMTAQLTAYEGQITKLQTQRDAAMEQMKKMEGEIEQAKSESEAALESKRSRERDLRIVLQHYEKLQKKYEATSKEFEEMTKKYKETVQKIDVLEDEINGKKMYAAGTENIDKEMEVEEEVENNGAPLYETTCENETAREASHVPGTVDILDDGNIGDEEGEESQEVSDENSIDELLNDMNNLKRENGKEMEEVARKRKDEADDINSVVDDLVSKSNDPPSSVEHADLVNKLKEAKESSTWKNEKIARVLSELKAVQDQVETLEEEKSRLQSDLSILKGHLLIAQKESANAKARQENREVNLRNTIAKHHRLQQAYETLETTFQEVQENLEAARKDSKLREAEAKEARKRAAGVHAQLRRLQIDHSVVLDQLERLKQELEMYKETPEY